MHGGDGGLCVSKISCGDCWILDSRACMPRRVWMVSFQYARYSKQEVTEWTLRRLKTNAETAGVRFPKTPSFAVLVEQVLIHKTTVGYFPLGLYFSFVECRSVAWVRVPSPPESTLDRVEQKMPLASLLWRSYPSSFLFGLLRIT